MRLCLFFSALLLSACTRGPEIVAAPAIVQADLLRPCSGYRGSFPVTEGQLSDALLAEAQGRSCANAKLGAINEILKSSELPD